MENMNEIITSTEISSETIDFTTLPTSKLTTSTGHNGMLPSSGTGINSFGTYIIILFSATVIVLIWAFFIFFFFSRGGRRTQFPNHTSFRSSLSSATTNSSFKSDSPPHYENAINSKTFPSVIILDPKMLEQDDAPPTYSSISLK